jgi:hypothetical protein
LNLLKSLFSGGPAPSSPSFYAVTVQCNRCGEIVEGRISMVNDLSAEYEDDHLVYRVRKVLMGSSRCFQQIEVELEFDASHKVIDRQISGGRFIEG